MNVNEIVRESVPKPDDSDYERGIMTRYFCRPTVRKSGEIKEISKETCSRLQKNPLYTTLEIIWKIGGPLEESKMDVTGKYEVDRSVKKANKATLKEAEKKMPGISAKLTNILQHRLTGMEL
jgi:hypothetical protein